MANLETEKRKALKMLEIECHGIFATKIIFILIHFLGINMSVLQSNLSCQASAEMEFGLKSLLAAGLVLLDLLRC